MSYVVTLEGVAPPARGDGVVFTKAKLQEAAVPTGPWTLIDTLNVAPGADAEHPEALTLTTLNATLEAGWYRVIWVDGANRETTPTAPMENLGELAGGLRPTVTAVAALLRARTKVRGGSEVGTFTASTRPTAEQVDELIDDAEDEVLGKVTPIAELREDADEAEGDAYERRIRGAIRLYTAILVETSYFPEQVKSGQSAASTYEKLYDSRIKALIAEGKAGEPEGEGGGQSPANAYWTFPADQGGLVGWQSRW